MEFDFTNAPPVKGRASSDRVPPGTYELEAETFDRTPAKSGRPMITATCRITTEGPGLGRKLVERFTFPLSSEDSSYGLQRWHAFLVALGMKERKGRAKLDLDKFVARGCVAEIDDEYQEANGQFPARTESRMMMWYRTDAPEAARVGEHREAEAVPPVAAAPVAAPAAAQSAAAAPASAPVAVAEAPTAPEGDDDLFDNL
jgi:hypothetical protein